MSMPALHSPWVGTSVPSRSIKACAKNVGRLPCPDALADLVEQVDQGVHVFGMEAAAEIPGGSGIGNAAGTQGIEKDLVITAQFQVLQAGGVAQRIVGEIEHMIRLMVG